LRSLQPLPDAPSWYPCFDYVQVNEEEMGQLSADPLSLATEILATGVTAVFVTLGERGAVYVVGGKRELQQAAGDDRMIKTARIESPAVELLDPTGCGDVFGATVFAQLLSGVPIEAAVIAGNSAAARNAAFRGASGLARHLRGSLVTP
jgi:sugar/nucleoside kinase (ribokinase family)